MSRPGVYTNAFYSDRNTLTRTSAEAVVSIVAGLVHPKSVVDLGCGVGTWLSVFRGMGCDEVLGLDGDYVDRKLLEIPAEAFRAADLAAPIRIEREFDLAMSLEVAEHLHAHHAEEFVRSLTRLAPVVLFSAAIPFQGGVHHVNEQWPAYWHAFFRKEGYVCIDLFRDTLWERSEVLYWYRQNCLLYVRETFLPGHPALKLAHEVHGGDPRALVHPEAYLRKCAATTSLRSAAVGLVRAVGTSVRSLFVANETSKGGSSR